jgi:hypothetical protein
MQRTHLLSRDLDWLPPRYRAIQLGVSSTILGGSLAGVGAVAILTHGHGFAVFVKLMAVTIGGGYVAGGRAARAILRGRLRKLATGAVDLTRLPAEPDGELVHVVGRVRVRDPVEGIVSRERAAYRRAVFSIDAHRLVHEAAEDFWLVAEGSEPVLVEVAGSRLLAPDAKMQAYKGDHVVVHTLEALPLPDKATRIVRLRNERRGKGKRVSPIRAAEVLLRDGDTVEVLGYKSRTIDPMVATRLERDTPYRATLRGGKQLPLLIAPRPA